MQIFADFGGFVPEGEFSLYPLGSGYNNPPIGIMMQKCPLFDEEGNMLPNQYPRPGIFHIQVRQIK